MSQNISFTGIGYIRCNEFDGELSQIIKRLREVNHGVAFTVHHEKEGSDSFNKGAVVLFATEHDAKDLKKFLEAKKADVDSKYPSVVKYYSEIRKGMENTYAQKVLADKGYYINNIQKYLKISPEIIVEDAKNVIKAMDKGLFDFKNLIIKKN